DRAMTARLAEGVDGERARVVELGLMHEEQHQELILTDILHVLSVNPLRPAYLEGAPGAPTEPAPLGWRSYDGGVVEIGFAGEGFCFDNERPRHRVFLEPFALATRPVTNGESGRASCREQ